MAQQDKTGEFLCCHCRTHVKGEAIIGYTYDDDFVDDVRVLHKNCEKPYRLAKAGKTHECPKCRGTGILKIETMYIASNPLGDVRFVTGAELYDKPYQWSSWTVEKWKEKEHKCSLCEGDGMLNSAPIPIITDWKLAP